jgi:hypothetical protein
MWQWFESFEQGPTLQFLGTLVEGSVTSGVINTEKSIALSSHTWQNKSPLKPQIIFNNRDVNYSRETKFLGPHVTECLKWEAHIRKLISDI